MNGQAEGFRLECKRLPLDFTTCDQSSTTGGGQSNRTSLSAWSAKKKHGMFRVVVVSDLVEFVCTCDCVVIMNFNQHVLSVVPW